MANSRGEKSRVSLTDSIEEEKKREHRRRRAEFQRRTRGRFEPNPKFKSTLIESCRSDESQPPSGNPTVAEPERYKQCKGLV